MTTRNIKSVQATADALVATAEEARARRKALATSKLSNETKRTSIAKKEALVKEGAHVVLMNLNDQRDSLDVADEKVEEELSQLDPNYFDKLDAVNAASAAETPPTIVAPPVPPEVIVTAPPVQTAPTVVLQEPQEALGLAKATDVTIETKSRSAADPRGWSSLQLLFAVILGLLGLLIGLRTVGWVVTGWNTNWWPLAITILQLFFGTVWVLSITGIGFFLGAFIGFKAPSWRESYRVRRENERVRVQTQTVPPAPPAA